MCDTFSSVSLLVVATSDGCKEVERERGREGGRFREIEG